MDIELHDFIKIENSYGSYQQWLSRYHYLSEFQSKRACSVASAANILAYEFRNKDYFKNIYLNKKNSFSAILFIAYYYMRPKPWGITNLHSFSKGFLKLSSYFGKNVQAITNKSRDLATIISFIEKALIQSHPIAMINWNPDIKDLRFHWITITGLKKDKGEYFILTSNWGEKKVYPLSPLISKNNLYTGLIYFKGL